MTWAHYLLQVNIYLVIFYCFYKLLLDKETYFVLNRAYLIAAGLLSLSIPFLRFEWFSKQAVAQPVFAGVGRMNDFVTQVSIVPETDQFTMGSFIVMLYLSGVLFFLFKFIFQLFAVSRLLKKVSRGSAFSFFTKKIIDDELPQYEIIHKHEEIHIRQLHTFDVLLFELIGIMTWFNPIVYLLKNTIKNIHEYLADEAAARFQGDKKEYALLLLSSAFGVTPSNLTNSFFNKSLIKKRIFMLHKERSKKIAMLKYGLFVPLFALTLIMSSATIRNNAEIQKVAEQIPLEEPLNLVTKALTTAATPLVEADGKANGTMKQKTTVNYLDWEDFYTHLKKSLRYLAPAQEAALQGFSYTLFTVNDGEIEDVKSGSPPLGLGLDEEVIRCLKSFSNYDAVPNGKYAIRIAFMLEGSDQNAKMKNKDFPVIKDHTLLNSDIVIRGYAKSPNSTSQETGNLDEVVTRANSVDPEEKVYDFTSLETSPSFPGGMEKFYQFLQKTVRYPLIAQELKIQGKVFLSFVVEADGSLTDIKVERMLGSGLDEEAIRVMKASPNWIPGTYKGKKVRVKYNIPLSFTLSDESASKANTPPLYVIDGEAVDSKDFNINEVSTNEITVIEVLKDATAISLYGDKAKYGVIKITTKSGEGLKQFRKEKSAETKKEK